MDRSYWHKQTDQPLFPDLLWSRPESRQHAGKLLIIGGNLQGFSAVAHAYTNSVTAGIGTTRVIMPDSIQRVVKSLIETAEFAPSTPSGSFSQKALAELLASAAWSDGVLLAGDLGRNSETAILIEKFIEKYQGHLIITDDSIDYVTTAANAILNRDNTCLVLSLSQLQKLAIESRYRHAITFDMELTRLVDWLHSFTAMHTISIVVQHHEVLFVAIGGEVSTTKSSLTDKHTWLIPSASRAAVWWLQNPSKPFEAITSSMFAAIT